MPVSLADGLVFSLGGAAGVAMLTWLVVFGRLEGQGVDWGEWMFRSAVTIVTAVALAAGLNSLWVFHPALVVLAPVLAVAAGVVTAKLTRRFKPYLRDPKSRTNFRMPYK